MDKEFLFYRDENGIDKIRVENIDFENETIWLSQKQIAELFDVTVTTISEHLSNIFNSNELDRNSTVRNFRIVQFEGGKQVSREIDHYNLDAIIAVGYRVNSYKATRFRQWATRILKEYLVKGFILDDDRLKQGKILFNKDYFDELLERIREIRASERRFYQKVTDLFSVTSYNYSPQTQEAKYFFSQSQNKLEYAVTNMTAAEIIKQRANHKLPNMNLKTWKGQGKGQKIIKSDVIIAKNYLNENEIKELNRLVNMFLDHAETLARKHIKMSMQDWIDKLDNFLQFNEYEVLSDYGSIKKSVADKLAIEEYEKFSPIQDELFKSDFDKLVEMAHHDRKIPTEIIEVIPDKVHEGEYLSNFNKSLNQALNYNSKNETRDLISFTKSLWKYALVVMYKNNEEVMTTKQINEGIPKLVEIPDELLAPLKGRKDDKYSQHVRNLKSHKKQKSNFIYQGYAEDVRGGFKITQKGIDFVESEMKAYL